MPNLDRTGPLGQGPVRGLRKRVTPLRRSTGKLQSGSGQCQCPKCGYTQPHTRGIPCTQIKCPKCGTPLRGIFCS